MRCHPGTDPVPPEVEPEPPHASETGTQTQPCWPPSPPPPWPGPSTGAKEGGQAWERGLFRISVHRPWPVGQWRRGLPAHPGGGGPLGRSYGWAGRRAGGGLERWALPCGYGRGRLADRWCWVVHRVGTPPPPRPSQRQVRIMLVISTPDPMPLPPPPRRCGPAGGARLSPLREGSGGSGKGARVTALFLQPKTLASKSLEEKNCMKPSNTSAVKMMSATWGIISSRQHVGVARSWHPAAWPLFCRYGPCHPGAEGAGGAQPTRNAPCARATHGVGECMWWTACGRVGDLGGVGAPFSDLHPPSKGGESRKQLAKCLNMLHTTDG